MKELLKKQLEELFKEPNWIERIGTFYSSSRIEIIWIMVDWVREEGSGKYLDEAMQIAEAFIDDIDPTVDDEANQEILKGNEYRGIVSVRGSNAWLVQAIISKLNTEYYPRAIDLVERLAKDPVHYVRTQAIYPLAALMVNVKAVNNPDGTIFDFKEEDKNRIINLALFMLEDNKDYPRVLEALADPFGRIRFASEHDSLFFLNRFIYTTEGVFYPEYVLERIVPLLIYYAEFRKDLGDKFNDSDHQKLLIEVIKTSDPRTVSTIMWLIWKTIEEDQVTYERFRKYISYLFDRDFGEDDLLGQYDIFVEKIIQFYPREGVELFKTYLKQVKNLLPKLKPVAGGRMWLYSGDMIAEKVAEFDPDYLPEMLEILKEVLLQGGYVGDVQKMFFSYIKAPEALHENLKEKIRPIYKQVQNYPFKPELKPLE